MAVMPPRPTLRKVRVRGYWQTLSDGTRRRFYEVFGPTGFRIHHTSSHASAIAAADKESRALHWRIAAGPHVCSTGGMLTCRPVGAEGIYCGHGRYLAHGERFVVGTTWVTLGQPSHPTHLPVLHG